MWEKGYILSLQLFDCFKVTSTSPAFPQLGLPYKLYGASRFVSTIPPGLNFKYLLLAEVQTLVKLDIGCQTVYIDLVSGPAWARTE